MAILGVVIPAFNRSNNLRLLLSSLERQTSQDFTVVIADDGSTDNTREMVLATAELSNWRGRLRWVGCGKNRGGRRGRARNIGVGNLPLQATDVLFLDSDIVLSPDAVEEHQRLLSCERPSTVFGMFDWLPPLPEETIGEFIEGGRFAELLALVPQIPQERVEGTFIGPELRRAELFNDMKRSALDGRWALYTNTSLPLASFESVNGFDEGMYGYGFEDMEFGLRCQQAGMECLYARGARGAHVWHAKASGELNELENQANLAYVMRKHGWSDYFGQQVDWQLWWHYTNGNGAQIVKVDQVLWVINSKGTNRLRIPDLTWLARLGFVQEQIGIASPSSLRNVTDSGIARLNEVDTLRNPYAH